MKNATSLVARLLGTELIHQFQIHYIWI